MSRRIGKQSHFVSFEPLEKRQLLAAHIVGSSTVYSTIQAAVNAASAGSTITVDAGTYAEEVTISKTLTIKGAEAGVNAASRVGGATSNESVISGAVSSGVHSCSFYIAANDVTIDGFTVQGETNTSGTTGAGVVIAPTISGTHILNNIIQNNVAGLFLANYSSTDAALIQHNYFANNNNAGSNSGRGIYTDGTVSGGNLTNVTIDSNTFVNNYGTDGIEAACAFQASASGEQSNIQITNNVMYGNGKAALFFNTTGVVISGNTITGCIDNGSAALRFEGNNHNVTIQYNTADNNTSPAVAIDSKGVPGDSSGFVITSNNFFDNNTSTSKAVSVVYNQDLYDGTLDVRNNWWGNASGPSGDGKGTGDAVSAATLNVVGNNETWVLVSGGAELYSPWLTSRYSSAPTAPTAPTGLSAVLASSSQVTLSWTDTAAGNESGFIVQRSTDGVSFSEIGTTNTGVTSYTDSTNVVSGTTYFYRVAASNSVGNSGYSNVASVAVNSTVATYLSNLTWVSETVGWGTIQKDKSIGGNTLTLDGTTYAKGIGAHAVSNIVYNLAGQYTSFISDVGVDDEENGKGVGSVDFQVTGDGKLLFDSGVLHNGNPPVHINISVVGVKQLTLTATNGVAGSIDYDHADWAGAELISSAPVAPTAPSGLSAVALSSSLISLTWTPTSSTQTSYAIDRSTDGTNFTTIAAGVSPSATSYADNGPLSASTKYYYRIRAVNSVGSSANSNIATATTAPLTTVTYVSNLTATSSTVGYGTIQKDKSINGNPLTLGGVVYAKGIGTHAASSITYNLAGKYSTFISAVGIDQEEDGAGQGFVDFQVIGDGKVLFDSGVLTNDQVDQIDVSVVGVQNLTLVATNGIPNDIDYDHADWAGAELLA